MEDYKVKTLNGVEELRSKCVRQHGEYYIINVDIVRVQWFDNKKWLLKDDQDLLFDIDNNRYVHSSNRLRYTTYDIDRYTTSDTFDCNLSESYIDGTYVMCTPAYIENEKLKLDTTSGIYYNDVIPEITSSLFYSNIKYSYDNSKALFDKFEELKIDKPLNKLLSGHSFGVELETSNGTVPVNDLLKLGVLPVRDGSTHNYEYVTKPLTQITSLIPIVDSIKKHCEFDISTSMHVHIGNVPTNKEFIAKFYNFMVNMQPQIYKMFPKYKFANEPKIKRKNYTQPLPKKVRFDTILNFLNNNEVCDQEYTGERLDHKFDIERAHKWQISSRYHWCNLIPLIFYPSRTIEFRIHQGTFNKYKVVYWLLICQALIKYVEDTGLTEEISMEELFKHAYPEESVSKALTFHYYDMVKYYTAYDERGDLGYKVDERDDYKYEPRVKLF